MERTAASRPMILSTPLPSHAICGCRAGLQWAQRQRGGRAGTTERIGCIVAGSRTGSRGGSASVRTQCKRRIARWGFKRLNEKFSHFKGDFLPFWFFEGFMSPPPPPSPWVQPTWSITYLGPPFNNLFCVVLYSTRWRHKYGSLLKWMGWWHEATQERLRRSKLGEVKRGRGGLRARWAALGLREELGEGHASKDNMYQR